MEEAETGGISRREKFKGSLLKNSKATFLREFRNLAGVFTLSLLKWYDKNIKVRRYKVNRLGIRERNNFLFNMAQQLSPEIEKLIERYQRNLRAQKLPKRVPTIHVDKVAHRVAALYEKIRRVIDWKEEHLVRRTAIERILKRMLLSEISGALITADLNAGEIAESLVTELVRGGHLPNDSIPCSWAVRVERVLAKYIYILGNCSKEDTISESKKKIDLYHWLLSVAACEVEDVLSPPVKEEALIECMTNIMAGAISGNSDFTLNNEEKWTQTYIAVHRALFHLDSPIIAYHLLSRRYADWSKISFSRLEEINNQIFDIAEDIGAELDHPLAGHFSMICEQYDTVYLLLGDALELLSGKPDGIPMEFASQPRLEDLIDIAYHRRLKTLKSRLLRMAVYSTLSIFVSSALSLFIVEAPLAKLVYGEFSPFAMMIDILFPTVLMFLLVGLVRPPSKKNLGRVMAHTKSVVYQGRGDIYEIKVRKGKRVIMGLFTKSLFILFTIISLGITVFIFYLSGIPISSIMIDTANIAVIVGAALWIRERSRELIVGMEERGFLTLLFDSLTVPIARFGSWLAVKWRKFTSVSIIFTALLDMPFVAFIDFIDSWNQFLKEQKRGIR